MSVYRFSPSTVDAGRRLDQYLASVTDLSRTKIRKIIDLGGVHSGGRRVRSCSFPVRTEEPIEVYVDNLPLDIFSIQDSHILFRDPYLLALNKPSGIETQPTPARFKGTLYEALQRSLRNPFRPLDAPSIGMVQRLDRETSGVIVFSTHPRAHRSLTEIFTQRKVEKTYLALVEGRVEQKEGIIRSTLAKNRASNLIRSVEKGGKEAVTLYTVLEEFPTVSLVEVRILTGRSHQIRVHFSESGHPLLGDLKYGGVEFLEGWRLPRLMLHSASLRFPHPVTGSQLLIEAPLPDDISSLLSYLRRSQREV